jgi:hypothetical protein
LEAAENEGFVCIFVHSTAEDEGFVCIFAYGKNSCFAAIQLAATKLPPAAWILFSNPYPMANKKRPHHSVWSFFWQL